MEDKKDIISTAKKLYKHGFPDNTNRGLMMDDLNFVNGEQWPPELQAQRNQAQRPFLTINRLPSFIAHVVGAQRANKTSIKVRPVEYGADPGMSEIFEGLVRDIEYRSRAEAVYDWAFECAVTCGLGFFRIVTEYENNKSFNQVIRLKRVQNPLSVIIDPAAEESTAIDMNYAFITEVIGKDEFKKRFGKSADMSGADLPTPAGTDNEGWYEPDGKKRIAEYWQRDKTDEDILLLSDGQVVEKKGFNRELYATQGITVSRERKRATHKVKQYIISGSEVLEEKDWPGQYIPVIPVFGKEINMGGKKIYRSLIRDSKDSQRMYNYWRTAATEMIALAPKSPYLVTPVQIENFEQDWARANQANNPYLLYNADPQTGGIPQRVPPPQVPAGIISEAVTAAQDIKDTIGIHDPALGMSTKVESGKALRMRQNASETSTYAFEDNLSRSILHGGVVITDLIPKIYDAERQVIIRTMEGTEKSAQLNKVGMDRNGPIIINDMTRVKMDVVITTGPTRATARMEAVDSIQEILSVNPHMANMVMDILAENMDWPGASQLAKRFKMLLPPGMAELKPGEKSALPLPPPPKVQMEMMKAQIKAEDMKTKRELGAGKLALEREIAAAKYNIDERELELKIRQAAMEIMMGLRPKEARGERDGEDMGGIQ